VRLLGSFHPQLAAQSHIPDGQDIDDALYGNEGGMEEQVNARRGGKPGERAGRGRVTSLLLGVDRVGWARGL
jgi:hypothetical protein